jgi:uncharacterized protein YneF (UPF0154 family)
MTINFISVVFFVLVTVLILLVDSVVGYIIIKKIFKRKEKENG